MAPTIRARFKDSQTIVVKVGTGVVSRADGSVAIGRVASVVEQIAQLRLQGKRVVLVASGAIGVGANRIHEQAVLSKSIRAHLINPCAGDKPSSARARAAAGQGGLMGLYDTLFSQYSVACGQLLVTEKDFQSSKPKERFFESLCWLLDAGSVPVVNENDVIARPELRALFQDNDSLAVLIATELKADLLLLLSDVPGVFERKPMAGETMQVLPYVTRSTKISFGEKSARGRGGMEAKVAAAIEAAEAGVGAVVIASGFAQESISKLVAGEELGTVFLSEACPEINQLSEQPSAQLQAQGARAAARALQKLSHEERIRVLDAMAQSLEDNAHEICAANEKDVAAFAASSKARGAAAGAMAARLVLTPKKLSGVANGIRSLARQPNPLGKITRNVELADGLVLEQETYAASHDASRCYARRPSGPAYRSADLVPLSRFASVPIGVLLVIFESRPDVLPQVAALSVASGNGVLLKGGKEALHTNEVLHRTLCAAITTSSAGRVPPAVLGFVQGRDEIKQLLALHKDIDLVIPRGSNSMVQHIMSSTRIPTLGHADGICHLFVDAHADLGKAEALTVDSKTDYPAACNALEVIEPNLRACFRPLGHPSLLVTSLAAPLYCPCISVAQTLLIHEALLSTGGAARLLDAARRANITVYGGPRAVTALELPAASSMRVEYGDLTMAIEIVSSVEEVMQCAHNTMCTPHGGPRALVL